MTEIRCIITKTLVTLTAAAMFICTNRIVYGCAEESDDNQNFISEQAAEILEAFAYNSFLENYTPYDQEVLYDENMEQRYILLKLNDGETDGYAIIDMYTQMVAESGTDLNNPYGEYADAEVKMYLPPMNYIAIENDIKIDSAAGIELTDEDISKHALRIRSAESQSAANTENVDGTRAMNAMTTFLAHYPSSFTFMTQPNAVTCVPTCFAMFFKYMVNRGRFTTSWTGTNAGMITELFNDMDDDGSGNVDSSNEVINGSNEFSNDYIYNSTSTYYSSITSSTYNTIKNEVDGDYPSVIVMTSASSGYGVRHAVLIVGYNDAFYNSSGGPFHQLFYIDPNTGTLKNTTYYTSYFDQYYTVTGWN